MAIAPNGPHGHLNGKVGNLVFYMLNGQPVVRLIGRKGKPSKLQLANYQEMAVTTKLLKGMGTYLKLGYGLQAKGTVHNAHNLATSYHKKHALKGEYPNISIDYSKVLLSRGVLSETEGLKINKVADGLEITWNPTPYGNLQSNDSVMVMICCPEAENNQEFLNVARRSEGKCFISLNKKQSKQQIEPYISFISADGTMVSDSVYLGNLNGNENIEIKKKQEKHQQVKERFDQIEASYLRRIKENYGFHPTTKAFKYLEKEYKVLKEQLEHLPGKPD